MKTIQKSLIFTIYALVLVLPGVIWWQISRDAFVGSVTPAIVYGLFFPVLGLYALSFLWIEFTLGAWRHVLNTIFNTSRLLSFHVAEGVFTFLFAWLHPLLLVLLIKQTGGDFFQTLLSLSMPLKAYWFLGQAGLLFLTLAALAGLLRRKEFIIKYWKYVHYLNYLVLPMILIHSWFMGSHVQGTAYETLWYFFTGTYIFSTIQSIVRKVSIHKSVAKRTTVSQSVLSAK